MSQHSGFSSASRMEIERLNEEKAIIAAKNAAEMAEKDKQLASLQSLLAANGLIEMGIKPHTSDTPSRKRHSSQQLGGTSKDSRCSNNRFEALMGSEDCGEFEDFENHAESMTVSTSTQKHAHRA